VCAQCGARGSSECPLRLCGGCRGARYCGGACQAAAWPGHFSECAGLAVQRRQQQQGEEVAGRAS
jgi:hypothetical protein